MQVEPEVNVVSVDTGRFRSRSRLLGPLFSGLDIVDCGISPYNDIDFALANRRTQLSQPRNDESSQL